ncbi:MAG: hypothetical protein LBG96_12640, partial [Tannerella sp.]|nr:hypothetical protein [Tannerella sp.]
MYFKTRNLINPETGKFDISYRIVESYRNPLGEVRQRTVLSVGFINHLSATQLDEIIAGLNARIKGEQLLFEDSGVKALVDTFYSRMVKEKKIDRLLSERKKDGDWETVDLNSLQSKDAREMGSEWIVSQAIEELGITGYLRSRSWSEEGIALAKTHLIARTVYPASEL